MTTQMSSGSNSGQIIDDSNVIPSGLMWWEWLFIFVYIPLACVLVWYVTMHLLVWDPSRSMAGLPIPITGALVLCLNWVILNFVLFGAYWVSLRKREKVLSSKGVKP